MAYTVMSKRKLRRLVEEKHVCMVTLVVAILSAPFCIYIIRLIAHAVNIIKLC